jgi:hypothetical protein
VRLFLPTFFFLAAFAGWGTIAAADFLARLVRQPPRYLRSALTAVVLGSAAIALYRIHPYELSYYNELIGGPRGAWERGFELSYWYDAFTDKVMADLNEKLPRDAEMDFFNDLTDTSAPVFQELQSLGALRGDIGRTPLAPNRFPFVWLLTQDSKAVAFTRLCFALRPWYASRPSQLGGSQVFAVADPLAVSRSYALKTLLEDSDRRKPPTPSAPNWVRDHVPWLGRFWGDGLTKVKPLAINRKLLAWSNADPAGLLAAARYLAAKRPITDDQNAQRLVNIIASEPDQLPVKQLLMEQLLKRCPEALVEAVEIINSHRDEVVAVMTRYAYTDPQLIGGYLDRDLPIVPKVDAVK